MKILVIHNVGVWGGSLKSLYEMISLLHNERNIRIDLLLPKTLHVDKFEKYCHVNQIGGIPQFDNTRLGHYQGLRWLILLREIWYWINFRLRLRSHKKKHRDYDIIHFNEIGNFYGCVSSVKKHYPDARIVSHVRSLQYEKKSFYSNYLQSKLNEKADFIIAIDNCVSRTLVGVDKNKVRLIANAFQIENEIQPEAFNKRQHVNILYLGGTEYRKGIDYFLEVLLKLKKKGFDGKVTIAGLSDSNPPLLKQIISYLLRPAGSKPSWTLGELNDFLDSNGLEDTVILKNFTQDISSLFENQDVLLFPSRYNAPGRPSIEAMRFGIPSIIFAKHEDSNIIINGYNGFNVLNFNTDHIVEKIFLLASNRDLLNQLKKNSFDYFHDEFSSSKFKERILSIYETLVDIEK